MTGPGNTVGPLREEQEMDPFQDQDWQDNMRRNTALQHAVDLAKSERFAPTEIVTYAGLFHQFLTDGDGPKDVPVKVPDPTVVYYHDQDIERDRVFVRVLPGEIMSDAWFNGDSVQFERGFYNTEAVVNGERFVPCPVSEVPEEFVL